jgi:hypothetical protein
VMAAAIMPGTGWAQAPEIAQLPQLARAVAARGRLTASDWLRQ